MPNDLTAATTMLDHRHAEILKPPRDYNAYTLGSIGRHNIAIACLAKRRTGTDPATIVEARTASTSLSIKASLMMNIDGGVPPKIRLGDIVVGTPVSQLPGVVQWSLIKKKEGGDFKRLGSLNNTPEPLFTALTKLITKHALMNSLMPENPDDMKNKWPRPVYKYPRSDSAEDYLFGADYGHFNKSTGRYIISSFNDSKERSRQFCDRSQLAKKPRDTGVHCGLIAPSSHIIKDTTVRDRLNKDLGDSTLLIREFAALLYDDEPLTSLIIAAVSKRGIGPERARNNFQKQLKHFAGDLRVEIANDRHRAFGQFIDSYSSNITRELFSMMSIRDQRSGLGIPELRGRLRTIRSRERKLEIFLQRLLDNSESTEPPNSSHPNDLNTLNEANEDIEQSGSNEHGDQVSITGEPHDDSFKHLDERKRFVLESIAYQTLHRRFHDFIQPSLRSRLRELVTRWSRPDHKYHAFVARYKLANLVTELQYIHPRKIRFDYDNDGSALSYCQGIIERWTLEHWDWWPLAPYRRSVKRSERRIRWQCICGEERWAEVPQPFAIRLISIICSLCKDGISLHDIQPPPNQDLQNGNDQGTHENRHGPTSPSTGGEGCEQPDGSLTADFPQPGSARPQADITNPKHWVLFMVNRGAEYKLAQICVSEVSCQEFFHKLRDEYFHLRGILRGYFSVWRYSHCDFYKFEKFEDHEFTPKHKDAFPGIANPDYEYQPKPMDSVPPVSEHEFKTRFYACYKPHPLLHWYHNCKTLGHKSHDLLKFFPKKLTELEEGGDGREIFWGIYAREIISLRWVLFYNFVCLLPMLAFFMVWISPLGRGTDLQNPSVPISMMIAMLSLFWSIFLSSLHFGKSH
ncbi:hypothetical protein V8C37DRAFT_383580 [Trichoderma ceciliae]